MKTEREQIADELESIGDEILNSTPERPVLPRRWELLGSLLLQAASLNAFNVGLNATLNKPAKPFSRWGEIWSVAWNGLVAAGLIESPPQDDKAGWRASCYAIAAIIRASCTTRAEQPLADPDKINKAIGIFSGNAHLGISDREVARRAGIPHPSTLTRSPQYQNVKRVFASEGPPKGAKDGRSRKIEAYSDSDDDIDDD